MQRKVPSAIENITLNRATFTDVPVADLTFVNFFYGNNGAGKSSIAHAIEEDDGVVWADGKSADDYDVLVYNQDFINENFVNYGDLKGVFIFGEEDIEAKKRIAVYSYYGERKNKNRLGKEDNLLSLSYGRVIRKDINTNDGLLPESFNTYNIVEAGDIIIRPTDLQNDKRSLRTGLVKEHGIITSAYIDLCQLKQVDSRYFHFLLHAYDVMKVFYNMGNGVRQGLNYSEFSRLMVFEPPYEEQVAMADYLETKVTEVDAIIEQKKEQMAVLDAYKCSLIFEYITGKKEVI